jgi:hypothetical protein
LLYLIVRKHGFIAGFLILFLSLLDGGSMFDEGAGEGYLWFLMGGLPVGFIFIVVSLIIKIYKRFGS